MENERENEKNEPDSEIVLNAQITRKWFPWQQQHFRRFHTRAQLGTKYLIKIYCRRKNLCELKSTRICTVNLNVIDEN